jgi:hypothetical protein
MDQCFNGSEDSHELRSDLTPHLVKRDLETRGVMWQANISESARVRRRKLGCGGTLRGAVVVNADRSLEARHESIDILSSRCGLSAAFAVGHTLGFRQSDPQWGVDALLTSMRAIHFDVQGFNRTYWDFYVGFGFLVSVFLVLAAVLAWQLGSFRAEILASMRLLTWAFAFCFIVVAFLSWRFFFAVPIVFSIVIAVCLISAAWLSSIHP